MNSTRRWFIGAAAGVAALLVGLAAAQPGRRLPRVAVVFISVPAAELTGVDPPSPYMRTFVHALRDLGLVEGRDIVIERRSAESRREHLDPLMQELVGLGVDVIVTGGPGVPAALRATDRIPIIGLVENALDSGLIDSLARPRRNLTGFGGNFEGVIGKQLQLLKEALPSISRVAVLATRQPPGPRAGATRSTRRRACCSSSRAGWPPMHPKTSRPHSRRSAASARTRCS